MKNRFMLLLATIVAVLGLGFTTSSAVAAEPDEQAAQQAYTQAVADVSAATGVPEDDLVQPQVVPFACRTIYGTASQACGMLLSNTEARIIMSTLIGAGGGAGNATCAIVFATNPPARIACQAIATGLSATGIASFNVVLSNNPSLGVVLTGSPVPSTPWLVHL